MTDSSPYRRKASDVLPSSTIYDPAEDREAPPGTEPTGTLVVLLIGEADRSWAAETALELSAAWARGGRRIVLADLHLENPILHEAVGDDNLEGMVDVFFYGASIARSARPVKGRGFYLIPAGTYTADLEGIYHHARWPKLIAGFREAGASLVLFAPVEGTDLEALVRWSPEVLVLGNVRDSAMLTAVGATDLTIRAHIVSPPRASRPSASPASPAPFASAASPASPALEERAVPVAAPRPAAAERARPRADDVLHLPPPPMRPVQKSRRVAFLLWLLLGVVVLAAIGYVVGRLRPDLLPWPTSSASPSRAAPAPTAVSPVAAVPAAARGGDALPYSVQVIAFQSLPAALERLAVDRERVSPGPVFLAPEQIDGILYYKVLAGALPDTTAARRLKEKLVADKIVEEEDAVGSLTLIQPTPLAFQLGEYRNEEAASAATDSLVARKIPAYSVPVPYSDGTHRWQLYAGAYRDSASAEAMRKLLSSTGLTPTLVARTGLALGKR